MPTIPQPSLSGGELSPSLYGRVDLALYQTSVKTCTNFLPQAYGGVKNRPGSRYVGDCYSHTRMSRLVQFSFSDTQNYVLEFCGGINPDTSSILPNGGDGYMRVYSHGRQQVYSADGVVTGAIKNNPVQIKIPWYYADLRKLKFSQSGDVLTVTHPNYAPCQIQRFSNDQWSIRKMPFNNGPFQAENFNKGVTVAYDVVEEGALVTLTSSGGAAFAGCDTGMLVKVQQINYGTPWEPGKSVSATEIRRSDGKYYRAEASGKTGTLRPTHEEGLWSDGGSDGSTAGGVSWRYLHSGFGVVQLISVASDGKSATGKITSRLPDAMAKPIAAASQVQVSGATPSPSGYLRLACTAHGIGTAGTTFNADISLLMSTGAADSFIPFGAASVAGIVVTDSIVDMIYAWNSTDFPTNPANLVGGSCWISVNSVTIDPNAPQSTYKWSIGSWGGQWGWPAASAYFQQRHCFAGTPGEPQTVWTSKTGNYSDFGASVPVLDDDALTWTVASAQIDGIQSLLTQDRLVMFTLGGNWVTPADPVTPSNISAKLQNYHGSSQLPPLGIGNTSLYYGKSGTVRDMAYDIASDSYVGNDLTVKSNHLLRDHWVVEWDFQQAPFPVVWLVRDDGQLLSMTYLKEEKVIGWAKHDLGGTVESICVINECGEDHIYMVVKRTISGATKRYIECMYGRVDDMYEACFVDSSLSYDGRNTTAGTTVTITGTYTAGGSVSLAASSAVFTTGGADTGNQIVVESADGTRTRVTLTSVASTTSASGTLVTALPADLQGVATDSWAKAQQSFSGLTHLKGKTVNVYADGQTYSAEVSDLGVVSLAGHPGYVVTVGLPIVADLGTLPVIAPGQQGPLRENAKLIPQVRVLVENSRSFYIGPDASNLTLAQIRPSYDEATPVTDTLATGIVECATTASWDRNGEILIRHTEATPLSVLAILPEVSMGGA